MGRGLPPVRTPPQPAARSRVRFVAAGAQGQSTVNSTGPITIFGVELFIRLDGPADLAGQIYQQVRESVLDGRLRPGEALPPSRELAQRLRVSRNTVVMAYDRLVAEGFLATRVGAGTFVSSLDVPGPAAESTPSGQVEGGLRPRRIWDDIPIPEDLSGLPDFDFRVGVPDARLFPYATWRRLLGRQFRASAVGSGMPCPPAGHWGLRAALARHLRVSRGVDTAADDVVVTCGIQQTLDLVGRVLLEPGACAAVEEPGYIPPRLAWRSQGARVVGVPVDQEGLVVDALPDDARLVYVAASHQLPTGVAMSLRRRMALLSWAHAHDAAVVEDDYDSEFRYTRPDPGAAAEPGPPRPGPLCGFVLQDAAADPPDRIPDRSTIAAGALHAAKFVSDWHTSLPTQAALADFIDQGALAGICVGCAGSTGCATTASPRRWPARWPGGWRSSPRPRACTSARTSGRIPAPI